MIVKRLVYHAICIYIVALFLIYRTLEDIQLRDLLVYPSLMPPPSSHLLPLWLILRVQMSKGRNGKGKRKGNKRNFRNYCIFIWFHDFLQHNLKKEDKMASISSVIDFQKLGQVKWFSKGFSYYQKISYDLKNPRLLIINPCCNSPEKQKRKTLQFTEKKHYHCLWPFPLIFQLNLMN